jgi:hypothetical protein
MRRQAVVNLFTLDSSSSYKNYQRVNSSKDTHNTTIQSKYTKLTLANKIVFVCLFVGWCFNATFNNISVMSWRSVLLVEETGGLGENHRPVACHQQTLSHNVCCTPHNISGDRH